MISSSLFELELYNFIIIIFILMLHFTAIIMIFHHYFVLQNNTCTKKHLISYSKCVYMNVLIVLVMIHWLICISEYEFCFIEHRRTLRTCVTSVQGSASADPPTSTCPGRTSSWLVWILKFLRLTLQTLIQRYMWASFTNIPRTVL